MNETLEATSYALIAMMGFGMGNAITKVYAQRLGPVRLLIYRGLGNVALLAIILLFALDDTNLDLQAIGVGSLWIIASYFGLMFFNKAVEVGKIGVVVPITASRIIFSVLVGVLFLDDSINVYQFIAIMTIMIGVAMLSLDFKDLKNSKLLSIESGIPFAILCAVFWGSTLPFFGKYADITGVVFFTLLTESIVLVMGTLNTLIIGQKLAISKNDLKANFWGITVIVLTSVFAGLAATAGYATGKVGLVSAISGAAPLVAVILSMILYKERLKLIQYAAVILIVGAIVLLPLV